MSRTCNEDSPMETKNCFSAMPVPSIINPHIEKQRFSFRSSSEPKSDSSNKESSKFKLLGKNALKNIFRSRSTSPKGKCQKRIDIQPPESHYKEIEEESFFLFDEKRYTDGSSSSVDKDDHQKLFYKRRSVDDLTVLNGKRKLKAKRSISYESFDVIYKKNKTAFGCSQSLEDDMKYLLDPQNIPKVFVSLDDDPPGSPEHDEKVYHSRHFYDRTTDGSSDSLFHSKSIDCLSLESRKPEKNKIKNKFCRSKNHSDEDLLDKEFSNSRKKSKVFRSNLLKRTDKIDELDSTESRIPTSASFDLEARIPLYDDKIYSESPLKVFRKFNLSRQAKNNKSRLNLEGKFLSEGFDEESVKESAENSSEESSCPSVPTDKPSRRTRLRDFLTRDSTSNSKQSSGEAVEESETILASVATTSSTQKLQGKGVASKSIGVKVAEYLARGGSRLQEQQKRLKSQIWTSVVTIVLVEGKDLATMDAEFSEHYVKFRLGNEKSKSKTSNKTLHPRWLEQFDLHLFEEQSPLLEIALWDKDRTRDEFIGRCVLDMREYEKETTHQIWADLEGAGEFNGMRVGSLFIMLTISGTTSSTSISDLVTYKDDPDEYKSIANRYSFFHLLENFKDVGCLIVKVYKAQGLAAADFGVGKSDPFCVLELVNARLQTQTEYKTLTPAWNKIFTFDVKDINSVLEVTVYDEDRDHKVDFLGKVIIPLLKIRNGEKKWYALKDKKLRIRAKGNYPELLLECSVFWHPIRAAVNTFNPKEEKYMQIDNKFKRQVLVRNVNRIKTFIMDGIEAGIFLKSCFEWEYPLRSIGAYIGFMLGVYYVEIHHITIGLLGVFFKNYIVNSLVGSRQLKDIDDHESFADDDDDDDDGKNKAEKEEEKKSLREKLMAVQETIATVQNAIGFIASMLERVKNASNFTVPYLSWLMIIVLIAATVILYMIPIRFLVMLWGTVKFSRKLIRPNCIVNNELLDYLSRIPDDEELRDYGELRTSTHVMENRLRGREGKKKKV